MDAKGPLAHLTDAELFGLAAPASGEPQPLPQHLSHCESCARALQEWRAAMRELGREDVEAIDDRPAEEWAAAREATMSAVRRARPRRTGAAVRWVAGTAAVILLVALAMPARREGARTPAAGAPTGMAFASAADREDDALLRDSEFIAQGGDEPEFVLEESL
jgi:hypothetical protein